jgi:4'-phosphopantetheinyl transferase
MTQMMIWLSELPEDKQKQVKRLRQPLDQYLSLAGLQLLKHSISDFSCKPFALNQLQYPDKGKPFIPGEIDFNISHSGEMVCCVVSDSVKVGIDIELQRQVYPGTIKKILSGNEEYDKQDNTLQDFFSVWTRKEAIVKAANAGSVYNLHEIQLASGGGYYLDHFWYCYPVDIISGESGKAYTCHIACSADSSEINIKQIHKLL